MFIILLVIAVILVFGLLFFLLIELNEVEKTLSTLVQKLTDRYEP